MNLNELKELIKKQIRLIEEREEDIEYENGKEKVIAILKGQKEIEASELIRKIISLDEEKKELEKQLAQLKEKTKEIADKYFDMEDAVLSRVIQTNEFIATVSKETNTITHDKEIFFQEIEKLYPHLNQQIKNLYESCLKTSKVFRKVTTKQLQEENVFEKIKNYISFMFKKVTQNLLIYDKKLQELKNKFLKEEQTNMKMKTNDLERILKEEIEKVLKEFEKIEGEDPALAMMTPEQKAEYLKWSKEDSSKKEKNALDDLDLSEKKTLKEDGDNLSNLSPEDLKSYLFSMLNDIKKDLENDTYWRDKSNFMRMAYCYEKLNKSFPLKENNTNLSEQEENKIELGKKGLGRGLNKSSVGKHNDISDDKFDPNELQMGIEIEKEHTDCPLMAKSIAKDHLSELPDYYSRLKKMEEKGKKEVSEPIKEEKELSDKEYDRLRFSILRSLKELEKMLGTTTNPLKKNEKRLYPICNAKLNQIVDIMKNETVKEEKTNPWAVCTSKVRRKDKDKYESCVLGVKKSAGIKKEELEQIVKEQFDKFLAKK